jgi:hypothetical protein
LADQAGNSRGSIGAGATYFFTAVDKVDLFLANYQQH